MSDLPVDVVDRALTLTRRARNVVDPNEATVYRQERDDLLTEHGYTARVRDDDDAAILVCYPTEWLVDGTVDIDRIEDTDRAVEIPLSGPGDPDDFDALESHNQAIAESIETDHGPIHGATARAFADFMSNHYAKPIEEATPAEIDEFRTEYFPRNAWPSDDQKRKLEESLELFDDIDSLDYR